MLLERLGTDAGLAIKSAQMKLFDLEAFLTFNILHNNNDDFVKAENLPRHQEMYQKGVVVALVYLLFSYSTRCAMYISLTAVLDTCSRSRSYHPTLLR